MFCFDVLILSIFLLFPLIVLILLLPKYDPIALNTFENENLLDLFSFTVEFESFESFDGYFLEECVLVNILFIS